MAESIKQTGNIVEAMVQIKAAMKKLLDNGLNKQAIIVLIHDRTRLAKRDIEKTLDTLCNLEKWYTVHK